MITLNCNPETEAGLLARAQVNGMSVEDYVLSMLQPRAASVGPTKLRGTRRRIRGMVERPSLYGAPFRLRCQP